MLGEENAGGVWGDLGLEGAFSSSLKRKKKRKKRTVSLVMHNAIDIDSWNPNDGSIKLPRLDYILK